MEITTEIVKQLRDKTGVSIMQCKKALEETQGDVDKAVLVLLKKSAGVAEKKQGRTLGAGIVVGALIAEKIYNSDRKYVYQKAQPVITEDIEYEEVPLPALPPSKTA